MLPQSVKNVTKDTITFVAMKKAQHLFLLKIPPNHIVTFIFQCQKIDWGSLTGICLFSSYWFFVLKFHNNNKSALIACSIMIFFFRICYSGCSEKVLETEKSLISTCCGRAFHKDCVQNMALTYGRHHLKCPLCSDKESFILGK